MRTAYLAKPSFFMSRAGLFAVLVALSGCSSDARRIEMPWSAPTASNNSANTVAWNNVQNNSADYTGSIAPANSVKSQDLPPVGGQRIAQADIVVDQGDTLYSIARKYHIPASALMKANHVYDANSIRTGQRLKLPEGAQAQSVRVASNAPFVASAPPANSSEHIVGTGDTLSSISKQYNVSPGELARANAFGPKDSLHAGQKLKIPHGDAAPMVSAKADLPKSATVKAPSEKAATAKLAVEAPVKVAKAEPAQKSAEPEATSSLPAPEPMNSTEFRWPVRGRVVLNYGPQQGGGKNDGINIAVPVGTPVKAAENGVVAYAGSELKGYGKLVLIRHDNDFVTAYAHNSEIEVKRGDKVTRGQEIGKAGQSGDVTQPQVHFEIRKGSTPLDPMTHLSGM
jgi:murein DD-endopeptidase MepM/ murein hydrolase activator NlpD